MSYDSYVNKLTFGVNPNSAGLTGKLDIKDNILSVEDKPAMDRQVGGEHYKNLPIQPIEYILKNGLGWLEGNAIKYITRHKQKGEVNDIKKAIHYLQILLEGYNEVKKF